MIAYSTGLFSSRDIFRIGVVLDLIGIGLLVTIVTAIWRLIGLI
jgi:di/tricarboxylate transporter